MGLASLLDGSISIVCKILEILCHKFIDVMKKKNNQFFKFKKKIFKSCHISTHGSTTKPKIHEDIYIYIYIYYLFIYLFSFHFLIPTLG
jgi:hypothetical protein